MGGGVQTSTLVEMMVEGEIPPVDVVIFSDTGAEPQYVYDNIEYHRKRLETIGVPLVIVSNGNMKDDLYQHGRFAAMPVFTRQFIPVSGFGKEAYEIQIGRMKRQCTSEYKIVPIERWIRQELLRRGLAKQNKKGAITPVKGVWTETILGISFDECERMKPNETKWIKNQWPLIDRKMKRSDCIEWLRSRGLPIPKKSACVFCPYHNKSYWRFLRDELPRDWAEVVQFDQDLRNGAIRLGATAKGELFLTEECLPLDQLDLTANNEKGQLDMCDEGFCFI